MIKNEDKFLSPGQVLHGSSYEYIIEKELGHGSFGITYLATTKVKIDGALGSIETKINVAIKEFFMQDINGREGSSVTCSNESGIYNNYKRKFAREAKNLSRINHPNIVKVLESFEANNTCYYAMEYCDGGSLDDLIKRKNRFSESEAIEYFNQVASALSYMHDHQMLHLDLKPSNIMLRSNGVLALIDFGLSKQYDQDGAPESSTTIGGGTPGYSPLEQINYHEGNGFAAAIDVYALGATLFKMLTGERPPESTVIFNDGFPKDLLLSKSVSEKLCVCIEKAMASAKRNRYQTVDEFAKAINSSQVSGDADMSVEATVIEIPLPEKDKTPEEDKGPLHFEEDDDSSDVTGRGKNKWRKPVLFAVLFICTVILGFLSMRECRRTNAESVVAQDSTIVNVKPLADTLIQNQKPKTSKVEKKKPETSSVPKVNTVQAEEPKAKTESVAEVAESDKNAEDVVTYALKEDANGKLTVEIEEIQVAEEVVEEEAIPFQLVEERPTFQGGDPNITFVTWVNNNLTYPEVAKENGVSGRVMLQFTVGADGTIGNVKVLRGVDPSLDKEAVRVVSSSPKWTPGYQRDKAVRVTYTFPVIFQLR